MKNDDDGDQRPATQSDQSTEQAEGMAGQRSQSTNKGRRRATTTTINNKKPKEGKGRRRRRRRRRRRIYTFTFTSQYRSIHSVSTRALWLRIMHTVQGHSRKTQTQTQTQTYQFVLNSF
jgi:hypothetical protein